MLYLGWFAEEQHVLKWIKYARSWSRLICCKIMLTEAGVRCNDSVEDKPRLPGIGSMVTYTALNK